MTTVQNVSLMQVTAAKTVLPIDMERIYGLTTYTGDHIYLRPLLFKLYVFTSGGGKNDSLI